MNDPGASVSRWMVLNAKGVCRFHFTTCCSAEVTDICIPQKEGHAVISFLKEDHLSVFNFMSFSTGYKQNPQKQIL